MARKRRGTIQAFTRPDGTVFYRARLRLSDGSRPWQDIPAKHCGSADDARDYARRLQALEETHGLLGAARRADGDASSADAWFDMWEASRKARGLTSTRDNRSHWEHHIRLAMGGKHVRDWSAEDVRALVRALDRKVQLGTLHWKAAVNIWSTAKKMAADSVASKHEELRVRAEDPTVKVEGRTAGRRRESSSSSPRSFRDSSPASACPCAGASSRRGRRGEREPSSRPKLQL
jgi:hypothetical protein